MICDMISQGVTWYPTWHQGSQLRLKPFSVIKKILYDHHSWLSWRVLSHTLTSWCRRLKRFRNSSYRDRPTPLCSGCGFVKAPVVRSLHLIPNIADSFCNNNQATRLRSWLSLKLVWLTPYILWITSKRSSKWTVRQTVLTVSTCLQ